MPGPFLPAAALLGVCAAMNISSHSCNDDARHFAFVRDTKLPRDTFASKRLTADQVVYLVCVVSAIVAALFIPVVGK